MQKLLNSYKRAAIGATQGLRKNWIIILGTIALWFIFNFIYMTVASAGLGIAGGFLLGFVMIGMLGLYYSWLARTVDGERIWWNNITEYDYPLFFQVISVAFIFFIVTYPLDLLAMGGQKAFSDLAGLAIVVLFNAVPEIIYIRRLESIEALVATFEFVKSKWLEWFLPLVIIVIPWLTLSPESVLVSLAQAEPLLPPLFIIKGIQIGLALLGPFGGILITIISVIAAHWFMLFRGHLFKELDNSSMNAFYR